MHKTTMLVLLLACGAVQAQTAMDIAVRLRGVHTLKCTVNWTYSTYFKDGVRSLESNQKTREWIFDNIDITKGTARIIASDGSDELSVRQDANSLQFTSESAFGNIFLTTVFPEYVRGTKDFVFVQSRHINGIFSMIGGQSYGFCSVIQ